MPYTIAVAGKGGTGKTTLSGLIVRHLVRGGKTPVLAVDADPNANLNEALGLTFDHTVVSTVDGFMAGKESMPTGVPRDRYLEFEVEDALVESKGFDLLVMGHTEGPGCYCAANTMLRNVIDRLETNYAYVVIDNEAGLEHISRQTTADLDMLLIVSDVSMRGMVTAARVKELIGEIRTSVGRVALVINRLDGDLTPEMEKAVAESGLELISTIPTDPQAAELDSRGLPLVRLPDDSPLMQAVRDISEKLGLL